MAIISIPGYVDNVLKTLEAGGHAAYLVGGCLRDMLLKREVHDWDVATAARCADIAALFPKTVMTGARFGTVTVITDDWPVEVTTFRSDGVYSDRRRPDDVRFVDDLFEDLKRRDFTINAMAMARSGVLSDPFGGQADLKRRLIRCVGNAEDRLSEDALRMFRALRFSAQLGFDIEADTMAAIRKCAQRCAALSAERVRDETEKILLSDITDMAGKAVSLGLFAGRLRAAGKEPENLNRLVSLPKDNMLRWAAFSAALWQGGLIDSAGGFLAAMRLDAKTIRHCGIGVDAALSKPLPPDKAGLKRLLADIGVGAARCAAVADFTLRGGDAVARLEQVITSGECFLLGELSVTGDDLVALGVTPGKGLGNMLKKLLEHVIEHPEDNKREVLLRFAEEIK